MNKFDLNSQDGGQIFEDLEHKNRKIFGNWNRG